MRARGGRDRTLSLPRPQLESGLLHSLFHCERGAQQQHPRRQSALRAGEAEKLHFPFSPVCLARLAPSLAALSAHSSSKFNSLAFVNVSGRSGRENGEWGKEGGKGGTRSQLHPQNSGRGARTQKNVASCFSSICLPLPSPMDETPPVFSGRPRPL